MMYLKTLLAVLAIYRQVIRWLRVECSRKGLGLIWSSSWHCSRGAEGNHGSPESSFSNPTPADYKSEEFPSSFLVSVLPVLRTSHRPVGFSVHAILRCCLSFWYYEWTAWHVMGSLWSMLSRYGLEWRRRRHHHDRLLEKLRNVGLKGKIILTAYQA